ncbi:hypothetical protein NL108_001287, partial [Boleophthalmus pectinirostris]
MLILSSCLTAALIWLSLTATHLCIPFVVLGCEITHRFENGLIPLLFPHTVLQMKSLLTMLMVKSRMFTDCLHQLPALSAHLVNQSISGSHQLTNPQSKSLPIKFLHLDPVYLTIWCAGKRLDK